ncbi:MAG: hypothetical protein JWO42_573 [Chloroflexi bacterium]|nr:hypothetical protein [Chloroflexota bacterium]
MPKRIGILVCAALLTAAFGFATLQARACAIDNVASVRADGRIAIRNLATPSGQAVSRWAPFVFRTAFAHSSTITFSEDLRELARTLPPEIVRGRWLWRFGDGATTRGQVVTHRYKHVGYYLLTVSMPLPRGQGTFVFDAVDVRVD